MSTRGATAYAKNLPIRSNVTSGMDRILSKPRCRVWNATGYIGAAAGGIGWTDMDYDTDGMTDVAGGSQYVTCRTAGLYIVQAHVEFTTGVGARFTGILDLANSRWIASTTTANARVDGAGATVHDITGLWHADAGEAVIIYISTSTDVTNIAAGQYSLFIAACLIST